MSEIVVKRHPSNSRESRENELRKRLRKCCQGNSISQIGRITRYNAETVRRYLNGESRITADFIGQLAHCFQLDSNYLLLGEDAVVTSESIRFVPTEILVNEFCRRFKMIEDHAVGQALISPCQ